jgi:molybdopterin-guanine dinucleotide biosynthesis protein A
MNITNDQLVGVILAGGLSRRMGGVEKSFIELNNKPLIAHSIDRLSKQLNHIAINANGEPTRFETFNLPVIKDPIEGYLGPLAGILAGMKWAKETHKNAQYVASIASDTPFFPIDFITQSCNALNQIQDKGKAKIILATSNDRHHPVFGLWPIELFDELNVFLTTSETQKVLAFVDQYQLIKVPFENQNFGDKNTEKYDPFFNINTPDDLSIAQEIAKQQVVKQD